MVEYTKMVISGGGINGIAIVGAVSEFAKHNDISKIKEIIGVSVGSIIALLVSIGYEMEEIEDLFQNIRMDEFTEYELYNIFETYGVDSGTMSKKLLKAVLANKDYDVNLTFSDLWSKRGVKLIVAGTNITLGRSEYFSIDNHPDMEVVDAVRISMSFPLMYSPVEFEGSMYVDGGVLSPYPIEYFEGAEDVIGFLINRNDVLPHDKDTHYDTSSLDKFLYSLLFNILDAYQDRCYIGYEKNTVFMNKGDLIKNVLSFDLTKQVKKDLMDRGRECYLKFIEKK